MREFLSRLATLFGVGYLRPAPGTWGTLATVPLVYTVSLLGPLPYMAFALVLTPLAIIAAEAFEQSQKHHDSSEVVIDEVIGFFITMTWLPATWQAYVAGFLLFRLLDITKPFPIGYLDRELPGGLGVVVDDIVAGIVANIILQILLTHTELLTGGWL